MKSSPLLLALSLGCTGGKSTNGLGDSEGSGGASAAFGKVLDSLADKVALTHFKDFESKAEAMAAQAEGFCESSTLAGLESVRAAWWDVRSPWKHGEVVQFGPIVEYPERLGPKIDDWPVNQSAVEDKLASDDPLDLEAFEIMGSATRGLPVIEYLLWFAGDGALEQFESEPRRCEMLVGGSHDVHANAERLRTSWEVSWADQLRGTATGDGLVFESEKEVVDQWVNRLVFTVENIRETKLGKPKGDSSNGTPLPDLIESPFSGRSLQDALDVLHGAEHVWSGGVDGAHSGIRDLVSGDTRLVEKVDNLFATSKDRLDDIPETLESSIYIEPEMVERAQSALVELQRVLQSEVAANIGITIRFNDNDGD
jgi:predicted lipoprotein